MKIIWQNKALEDLENILEFITNKDNYAKAKKLVNQIIEKANNLVIFPEKYQKETLIETERNMRRAIIHSYKIYYEVTDNEIFILHIFYTVQNPYKLNNI